jgi:hypothetical protein
MIKTFEEYNPLKNDNIDEMILYVVRADDYIIDKNKKLVKIEGMKTLLQHAWYDAHSAEMHHMDICDDFLLETEDGDPDEEGMMKLADHYGAWPEVYKLFVVVKDYEWSDSDSLNL